MRTVHTARLPRHGGDCPHVRVLTAPLTSFSMLYHEGSWTSPHPFPDEDTLIEETHENSFPFGGVLTEWTYLLASFFVFPESRVSCLCNAKPLTGKGEPTPNNLLPA